MKTSSSGLTVYKKTPDATKGFRGLEVRSLERPLRHTSSAFRWISFVAIPTPDLRIGFTL
jgi:hypothetical protein